MDDAIDSRRAVSIDPALWHLHIRYPDYNWLGQKSTSRDELREFTSEAAANEAAEATQANALDRGINLLFCEVMAPGTMPHLHSTTAWYLDHYILTHDGTILQRNVRRRLLDHHANEAEAREAFTGLQHYMLGQGGRMLYAAILPPNGHGPTIVLADRRTL